MSGNKAGKERMDAKGSRRLYGSKKRGIYYTLDALLASLLLLGTVIVIFMAYDQTPVHNEEKIFITQDALTILSSTRLDEVNTSFIREEIQNGNITNTNMTVLEQIGEYWVLNKTDKAKALFESILPAQLINNMGLRLTLGDEEIYVKNYTTKKNLFTFSRMMSGMVKDAPLTGYSSSAYLKKIRDKKTSSYYYLGGYIGQGNISFYLEGLPADLSASKITQVYLEGMFEKNFTLFVNGTQCNGSGPQGQFIVSGSNNSPSQFNVTHCNSSITYPRTLFNIFFEGNVTSSAVAGGFVKVQYKTDVLQQNITLGQSRYFFPQIKGVANIYDSFYVPGTLTGMDIYLHFNSSQRTFLTIGEREIDIPANGTTEIILNNSYLLNSEGFDYSQLSRNTVPLRFASYNATVQYVTGGNADVVLITDLSGSMKHATDSWGNGNSAPDCISFVDNPDTRRTRAAACLDMGFVNTIMNYSGNRIWPLYIKGDKVFFYNDPDSKLNVVSNINSYYNDQGDGKTCLACAVNLAHDILQNYSNASRKKFVVLMTDGVPTHCAQGSCNSTSYTYGTKTCEGLCDVNGACGDTAGECAECITANGAYNNTIFSTNRTVKDLNATFYTIGLGPTEDCVLCNQTLRTIATLGNGTYQHSKNVSELQMIYNNISYEILEKVLQENQMAIVTGNLTTSDIYGDSYINLTYDPIVPQINPGRMSVTLQVPLSNCTSTVKIPAGIDVVDAKVISYSGSHWSDTVVVNGITVFNLSDYYVPYYKLGDPTVIQVPTDVLSVGGNNTFFVETGDSPENRTGCSPFDSFIYTAMVPSATSRTNVEENNEGCLWTVRYIDGDSSNIAVPSSYSGTKRCSYQPGNITYDIKDTYDVATYKLLRQLDTENAGTVLVNINNLDLEIITTVISGVPYLWGPSMMRLEAWQ